LLQQCELKLKREEKLKKTEDVKRKLKDADRSALEPKVIIHHQFFNRKKSKRDKGRMQKEDVTSCTERDLKKRQNGSGANERKHNDATGIAIGCLARCGNCMPL
jgi:hypothetical protein